MVSAGYALEHFYYGQIVRDGKAEGELRLLAASEHLGEEQINEVMRSAIIPPVIGSPLGSWALVRGRSVPFILVQSHVTRPTAAMLHFIVMPVDVLRSLGGNISGIMSVLEEQMPTFAEPGQRLDRLIFPQLGEPSANSQIDAMLELMTATRDRLNLVEALLASLIQGVQIVIVDAPEDPKKRAAFIEGLLALLPPPARFGVTFAMHTTESSRVDAQIRFASHPDVSNNALIYHWKRAELTGPEVIDNYSRFIVSQLRLDPDMVIQQTNALTAVASWRIRRGDSLASALGYASYRLRIDNSLTNNLPVEADDASRILKEDPTLSDKLRLTYGQHVLKLTLALGEAEHAEPIGVMLREQPELEDAMLTLLREGVREGKTQAVYDVLVMWLTNPLGPDGLAWGELAGATALARLNELMETGNAQQVRQFIQQLHETDERVDLYRVIPKVIETATPLTKDDRQLAEMLVLLGADYLDGEQFRKLMTSPALLTQMSEPVKQLVAYYGDGQTGPAPNGLLTRAASSFEGEWEMLMMLRLTEAALLSDRADLLDTSALSMLAQAAHSPYGEPFDHILRSVVTTLSTDELLPTLDDPGPRYLLQILLVRQHYTELAGELLRHSRVLYSADRQGDYAVMVRRLFAETPVDAETVPETMDALRGAGVKPLPLAMAHLGAMKQGNWSAMMAPVAQKVTALLFENRSVVDAIPPASLLELLKYHVQREDEKESIRAAGLLPHVAVSKGEGGVALMTQMYKMMSWDERPTVAALEILRRYVRMADSSFARAVIGRLQNELGVEVGRALQMTYRFRLMMHDQDMIDYASNLHLATEFLKAPTMVYVDKDTLPGIKSLYGDLDSLAGGLNAEERKTTARAIMNLGRAIVMLSRQQKDARVRDLESHIEQLVFGNANPQTALDVLWVIGGYFSRKRRLRAKIEAPPSKHPLGDRTAPSLMREAQLSGDLLRSLMRAFPVEESMKFSGQDIRNEIESLWGDLPLVERREMVKNLAYDFQHMPDLVVHIAERGDARVMEENSRQGRRMDANRANPESVLEFYRFVHGYFGGG